MKNHNKVFIEIEVFLIKLPSIVMRRICESSLIGRLHSKHSYLSEIPKISLSFDSFFLALNAERKAAKNLSKNELGTVLGLISVGCWLFKSIHNFANTLCELNFIFLAQFYSEFRIGLKILNSVIVLERRHE